MNNKKNKKKLDYTTLIFVIVILFFAGIGIFGSKLGNGDNPTSLKTTTNAKYDSKKQPILGNKSAPLHIVEFGDYNCSHCKEFEEKMFPWIQSNLVDTNQATFSFVNYAFMDATSYYAAMAAEKVQKENPEYFWNFHKALFDSTMIKTPKNLADLASKSVPNVNIKEFTKSIENQDFIDDVLSDKQYAKKLGVDSTPRLFINGREVTNPFNPDEITNLVALELEKIKKESGKND